jgi:hypothetical protein
LRVAALVGDADVGASGVLDRRYGFGENRLYQSDINPRRGLIRFAVSVEDASFLGRAVGGGPKKLDSMISSESAKI